MRYIALLRGINVGGHNKITMSELKVVFERVGMQNVSTYINSGNVIFESDINSKDKATNILEKAIETSLGLSIKVIIRDKNNILSLAKSLPDNWVNDTNTKCDVMFLWDSIDNPDVLKQITIKPDIDNVAYVPGALLWLVDRKNLTKSGMQKLVGTNIYKQMTIRNCNTVRKLTTLVGQ